MQTWYGPAKYGKREFWWSHQNDVSLIWREHEDPAQIVMAIHPIVVKISVKATNVNLVVALQEKSVDLLSY